MPIKIPEDASAFFALACHFGLNAQTEPCVRARLETAGKLITVPGQKEALVSRQHFIEALEFFCDEVPGVRAMLKNADRVRQSNAIRRPDNHAQLLSERKRGQR